MENEMHCRAYDSTAIATMACAFNKAFGELSEGSKRRPNVKQNLALCVIRFFDEGESDPLQLSRMALAINAFSDRKPTNNKGMIAIPPGLGKSPVAF
jgi:hypothetical protein